MKYRIKLIYKYSDIVEVEADSEHEAIEKAIDSEYIDEKFECLYDAEIYGDPV